MKHKNIAIFIPHLGCTQQCSFCNQNLISGTFSPPEIPEVYSILQKAACEIVDKSETEIAFFGGSFTAINRQYMQELLHVASEFIGRNGFKGVRISTRPDMIDDRILDYLQENNVTSIELGAQSMVDRVLEKNARGHTAKDVVIASNLIKKWGFELGLQMMVGLYGDSDDKARYTCRRIIEIAPKTVRIYPTVILKRTMLSRVMSDFEMMSLDHAVTLCAELLWEFNLNNIDVIKLGLHASTDIEKDICGGIYHPAFRELCESELYYKLAYNLLNGKKNATVFVKPTAISKMIGQNRSNEKRFRRDGYMLKFKQDDSLPDFQVRVV